MKRLKQATLSPLDLVILIKLALSQGQQVSQSGLAADLFISQSEVSKSLDRSRYARLVSGDYEVMLLGLMEFLEHGVKYCFPQQPGAMVRGIPTAHSYGALSEEIDGSEVYVWPSPKGKVRGQAITPLYPSILQAVVLDNALYSALALVDAIRVGRNREKNKAISFLWNYLMNEEYPNKPQSYR